MNAWLNLVTFVVCRFGGMVAIFVGMFIWYRRVSVFYFVTLSMSMIVMTPVNTILFKRLLKNDVFRFRKNTYHNKYRTQHHPPSPTTTSAVGYSANSNNNMSKVGKNGHPRQHYPNGFFNGVVSSFDDSEKCKGA